LQLSEDQLAADAEAKQTSAVSRPDSDVSGFKVPPPPGYKPRNVANDQTESPAKKLKGVYVVMQGLFSAKLSVFQTFEYVISW
jgi:hypothetical protein